MERERDTQKHTHTVLLFLIFTTYYDRKGSKPVFVCIQYEEQAPVLHIRVKWFLNWWLEVRAYGGIRKLSFKISYLMWCVLKGCRKLERWLHGQELILILQGAWPPFLVPRSGSSHLPATPDPGDPVPSFALSGHFTHIHIPHPTPSPPKHTHRYKHNLNQSKSPWKRGRKWGEDKAKLVEVLPESLHAPESQRDSLVLYFETWVAPC